MPQRDVKLETCRNRVEAGKRNTYWATLITRLGVGDVVGVHNVENTPTNIDVMLSVYVERTDPRLITFMAKLKGYMR